MRSYSASMISLGCLLVFAGCDTSTPSSSSTTNETQPAANSGNASTSSEDTEFSPIGKWISVSIFRGMSDAENYLEFKEDKTYTGLFRSERSYEPGTKHVDTVKQEGTWEFDGTTLTTTGESVSAVEKHDAEGKVEVKDGSTKPVNDTYKVLNPEYMKRERDSSGWVIDGKDEYKYLK